MKQKKCNQSMNKILNKLGLKDKFSNCLLELQTLEENWPIAFLTLRIIK